MQKGMRRHSFLGDLLAILGVAIVLYGLAFQVTVAATSALVGFTLIVFSQDVGRSLFK
ncbi:hypothetical protein FC99_GL000737 [Levilactobacillus koreensis JCM 16448]|uniref:hypothetical protein n=1 Tax=Levilactobacillus koreensis TaxID=637971 RepID=UPI0006F05A4D|nr:hypothetical protein [Levilactobacillus koreensis]KRK87932.1 hypothetical protein FC99_GL000737 [Levilactobacillus koreensis JCM 16448]